MTEKQDFQNKRWQCLIKEYQESGMKLNNWCASNEVTKDQYYYWLSKVRQKYHGVAVKQFQTSNTSSNVGITSEDRIGSFVEINPELVNETFRQASLPVAVVQKDNIRIEIMSNASASFIKQLLTAVQYA